MLPWGLILAAGVLGPPIGAQQPDAMGQLSGAVRNSVTGLPVVKATVRLIPAGGRVGYVRTSGATGDFAFEGIVPGDYQMRVERRGFLDEAKGAHTGSVVHLSAGQRITDFEVLATPVAVISGTVTDSDGEPVPRAVVHLIVARWSMHGRRYQESDGNSANEQGEFRLTDLEPGRYYLFAGRPDEGPMAAPVADAAGKGEVSLAGAYYPNASSIDGGAPIDLRPGQELRGITFRLSWAPSFHVRGQAPAGAVEELQLVKRYNDTALPWEQHETGQHRDGSFDIAGVPAGNYYLRVALNWRTGANTPVAVDSRDVNGVTVSASLAEFRALVRTEAEGVLLHLQRIDGPGFDRETTIPVQRDGTARLTGIGPARYILWASSRTGSVYVKSVQIGQQELRAPELDFTSGGPGELEIVVSAGGGRIQGTVQWPDPATSGPAFAAGDRIRAVLVPQEARAGIRAVWFSDIDQSSGFTFSEIPPGKYFAFVTANLDEGLWMNRDFVALVQGSGAPVELPDEKGSSAPVKAPPLPLAVAQRAMEGIR